MVERIFATGLVKEQIEAELKAYREDHERYIRERHPQTSFVTLEVLAHDPHYATLSSPIENYIYRDCTGQLKPADMLHLREIERGIASFSMP